jgi:hypothetical protein|tara:strand:- start:173 stop:1456 length:1284 start_codon:yes stop_codon:yes gene_type:complete
MAFSKEDELALANTLSLGASGTGINDFSDKNGALYSFLKQTSGGEANAQRAIELANQLAPIAPEPDKYEAMFRFFSAMGKGASERGSTVASSALSAMDVPLDYMNSKKKQLADSKSAQMKAALQLGPSLKPTTKGRGTPVKIVLPDGSIGLAYPDDVIKNNLQIYIEGKSNKSTAATAFSKMYDDLGTAEDEAKANALQFLADNPLATPEDILAAAEADSAVQEAKTLQKQIDTAALSAGFNKEIFAGERDIRKEWNNFKKPFNKIQIGYQKLVKSLESESGPGDMAAVFGFMKLLDPGSVVRESEFSAAQNTSGLMDRIYLQKNKLTEGEALTPKQRKDFMKLATQFYNLTSVQFGDARLDLGQVVKNNSVFKVENIFGSEEGPPSWYLDPQNYSDANDLGITAEAFWLQLSPAEQDAWIAANGGS